MTLVFCTDVLVTPHFFVCGFTIFILGKEKLYYRKEHTFKENSKSFESWGGKKSSLAKEMESPMREYFWLPFRKGEDAPEIPAKKGTIQRISFIWQMSCH